MAAMDANPKPSSDIPGVDLETPVLVKLYINDDP
jgi:hypothetical protein